MARPGPGVAGLAGLSCPRCGRAFGTELVGSGAGCPECRREGVPVNLVCDPIDGRPSAAEAALRHASDWDKRGIWRYAPLLPVQTDDPVSLGEGGTPLVRLERVEPAGSIERLYAKVEAANPTWSHKDRLCSVAVTAARVAGAKVVTAASTGNHGASAAAYAARAGLDCVVFTLRSIPRPMAAFMLAYGARVVALETANDRNRVMMECVRRFGWYPVSNGSVPPIGGDPFGVEGYRTIAYELWEQLGGAVPSWIIVPVSYGDALAGVWRGFLDLRRLGLTDRLPRLAAAEVSGGLEAALRDGRELPALANVPESRAFSVANEQSTYQALATLRESGGLARSVSAAELDRSQSDLGAQEGLFVESAAALTLAVARRLVTEGIVRREDRVVLLLTSGGLKELPSGGGRRAIPIVRPNVEAVRRSLGSAWPA